ncbi:hypothetical protein CRUP_029264 [Coryphaenoides rupestris]|nr:hypothetical protein CRUP_029264 [Coryphaenoides rupestris]
MYSQFPNGAANGYGAIRGYGSTASCRPEGTVLRGPGLQRGRSLRCPRHCTRITRTSCTTPITRTRSRTTPASRTSKPTATRTLRAPPATRRHSIPRNTTCPNTPHIMTPHAPTPTPCSCCPLPVPPPSLVDRRPVVANPSTPVDGAQRGAEEDQLPGDQEETQKDQATQLQRQEREEEGGRGKRGCRSTFQEEEGGLGRPGPATGESTGQVETQETQETQPQPTEPVPKVHHPSVIQETGFCKEFVIGDSGLVQGGTYPWWPCMVSSDPQMKVTRAINTRGSTMCSSSVVVAERAWIHEKRIVMYQGEHQFEELQAETLRKTTNLAEKHKWEVGVGHAEDAFVMTKQERIDNYTFIYVDPDPNQPPPAKKPPIARAEKRTQRSASASKKEEGGVTSPDESSQRRRWGGGSASSHAGSCRAANVAFKTPTTAVAPTPRPRTGSGGAAKRGDPGQSGSPASDAVAAASEGGARQDSSPPPTKVVPSPKREREEEEDKEERVEGEVRQPDLGYCSPEDCGAKPEPSPEEEEEEEEEADEAEEDREERRGSPASQRSEEGGMHPTSSPGSHHSSPPGSQERKQQRRSIRSRSESERGSDPVPKKKTKKEQGASEISDACKPLKKRSRASTDVEMASSQYRDTSDSDSRGLNDPQGLFGKSLDSPAAADADASDTQSVDSNMSQQTSTSGKKDTVCQICEVYGEGLVVCEGDCCRHFHLECLGLTSLVDNKFTCSECKNGESPRPCVLLI